MNSSPSARRRALGLMGIAAAAASISATGLTTRLRQTADVSDTVELWNTWLVGKPLFGTGRSTLTAYLMKGTAPAVVSNARPVSNVVVVPFTIAR